MVTNNFNEPAYSMTRGSAYILYKKDNKIWIGYSGEFNGNMYPGGNYEDMVNALFDIKTYEDYGLIMHKFNKEHHNYSVFDIYHSTLNTYLNKETKNKINFDVEYYKHWFSDYIFFINLTGSNFYFADTEKQLVPSSNGTVTVFNYGKLESVYVCPIIEEIDKDKVNP